MNEKNQQDYELEHDFNQKMVDLLNESTKYEIEPKVNFSVSDFLSIPEIEFKDNSKHEPVMVIRHLYLKINEQEKLLTQQMKKLYDEFIQTHQLSNFEKQLLLEYGLVSKAKYSPFLKTDFNQNLYFEIYQKFLQEFANNFENFKEYQDSAIEFSHRKISFFKLKDSEEDYWVPQKLFQKFIFEVLQIDIKSIDWQNKDHEQFLRELLLGFCFSIPQNIKNRRYCATLLPITNQIRFFHPIWMRKNKNVHLRYAFNQSVKRKDEYKIF